MNKLVLILGSLICICFSQLSAQQIYIYPDAWKNKVAINDYSAGSDKSFWFDMELDGQLDKIEFFH